jgi:hypothetical protein
MNGYDLAERALFADLTQLLLSMREATHGELEAVIEERFRKFVRARATEAGGYAAGGLQITFTWTLPDGADDWAVYGTEYKVLPAQTREEPQRAAAVGGAGAVIDFPSLPSGRPTTPSGSTARIIAFPVR